MGKMTKATMIKRELKRLTELFNCLPENEQKFIKPMLENAAFMAVTMRQLQEVINQEGCDEEYKNGENQYGKKASANLQSYNALMKNYIPLMSKLKEMLPKGTAKSKLEELMKDD